MNPLSIHWDHVNSMVTKNRTRASRQWLTSPPKKTREDVEGGEDENDDFGRVCLFPDVHGNKDRRQDEHARGKAEGIRVVDESKATPRAARVSGRVRDQAKALSEA